MPGRDVDADAELVVHPLLQVFEVLQALEVFQALQQDFFLLSRQLQNAQISAGSFQQLFTVADTGAGWAGLAKGH